MPEISIDVGELRKRKILVTTPMYGGMCGGQYTKSTADLAKLAMQYQMTIDFFYLFNESLITRARNYCADEFLRNTNYTHLMFIDSDIGFDPHDVLSLAALADPESDKDILCGPYPKKTISWEKIKLAVDKGFADENPQNLGKYVGDFVFNPVQGATEIAIEEPCEVMEGGTGFMMIQRKTFEKYAEAYPELMYVPDHVRSEHFDGTREIMCYFDALIDPKSKYKPDHVRTKNFDGTREIMAFFDCVICPDSKRYLSEDYMFCQWAREIGLKVWMCPWMQLGHTGTYTFAGSLGDLANIGASATADPQNEKLK